MTLSLSGLGIVALAATLNGVFTVPLKFMSGWEWENAWLVYTLVGTIVLPWILVAASIPHVVEVYAGAPLSEIGMAAGFGFAWGVGGVLFGVCVTLVGNALTFAVVLGLTSCIGSLAPFIIDHPDELGSTQGILNYVALAIVIVSLAVISVAGTFKDKQQQRVAKVQAAVAGDVAPLAEALLERGDDASDVSTPAANGGKTMLGLVLCVVSGLLSPMLNFPLAFCTEIPARARSLNASKLMAPNTVWALALLFGMVPNAAYAVFLLIKRGTWRNFCRSCSPQFRDDRSIADGASSAEAARALLALDVCNYALAALMGGCWFTANICYSVGAEMLGEQGPVLGWAIFICGMILVANVAGFLLREWEGVELWTIVLQIVGLALVCSAIVCLSLAGLYATKAD